MQFACSAAIVAQCVGVSRRRFISREIFDYPNKLLPYGFLKIWNAIVGISINWQFFDIGANKNTSLSLFIMYLTNYSSLLIPFVNRFTSTNLLYKVVSIVESLYRSEVLTIVSLCHNKVFLKGPFFRIQWLLLALLFHNYINQECSI